MGEDEPGQAAAVAQGIHVIALPTPFLVGRVNLYLIDDEPLTLVDTGPNSGKSLDELEQGLAAHGRTIEQLGLIIVTHQHIDHVGLLEIVARRSGAEVAALGGLAPYLRHFSANAAADDAFSMQIMLRHGVPPDLAGALGAVGAAFRAFGSSGEVTLPLADGETITLRDRSLRVAHRPGHSPSDTVFFDERRGTLLAGDHLLARISSNPLLSRPLEAAARVPGKADAGHPGGADAGDPGGADAGDPGGADRPRALQTYIASLRATREMAGVALVLGGHGPPVLDHVALIDERFRMHDRRARKLAGMLEAGPATAYELATRMWGNVAVTQAFLTISEVLGHMDLLIADGRADEVDDGEVIRFSLR
jgi:glyoxylase-like metal-dependent hydrolase (beta-lactamase superfamily II)